ncbi:MAG: hypothetical protein HFE78_05010 [Clostridiales bacterium]|nr:hypothetical protein [Clostridiales bacterium]
MKNCAHCGCVNDSINRYCRNCGVRFAEEIQTPPADRQVPEKESLPKAAETDFLRPRVSDGEPIPAPNREEAQPTVIPSTSVVQDASTNHDGNRVRPLIDFDFMDQNEPAGEEPVELAPFPFSRNPEQTNETIQTLRKNGRSVCTLLFCLFFTVYLVLSVWSAADFFTSYEVNLLMMEDAQSGPVLERNVLAGVLLSAQVLRFIPGLLTMIGMWLFYGACLNRRRPFVKTSGLAVVFSGAVVQICSLVLGALLVLAGGLLAGARIAGYIETEGELASLLTFLTLFGFAVTVVVVLGIVYCAKLIGLIRRVRRTSATGEADAGISVFIIVMNFLSVLGGALRIGNNIAAGDYIGMGASIANMLALIFISVVLLQYKEGMKNIIYRIEHPLPAKM